MTDVDGYYFDTSLTQSTYTQRAYHTSGSLPMKRIATGRQPTIDKSPMKEKVVLASYPESQDVLATECDFESKDTLKMDIRSESGNADIHRKALKSSVSGNSEQGSHISDTTDANDLNTSHSSYRERLASLAQIKRTKMLTDDNYEMLKMLVFTVSLVCNACIYGGLFALAWYKFSPDPADRVGHTRAVVTILFIVPSKILGTHSNEYRKAYILILAWALMVMIPRSVLFYINPNGYDLAVDLIIACATSFWFLVLIYYTWKCKGVTQTYSDWKQNVYAGLGIAVLPLFILIMRANVFTEIPDNYVTNSGIILLRTFVIFFMQSIAVTQLFSITAAIVFFDLKTSEKLDPDKLFENSLVKQDTKRLSTIESTCIVRKSSFNEYGPSFPVRTAVIITE
ncbi:hypothetical protein SARC_10781 [Sphaeroforma arctica JP610]|uniref:Uncharacterized protein n=1 Tax=Sphaeroforma arctica JP610 TaxID=667725 RepID=A0A0L0FIY2_9EUKA|nr:hypothetical protein SARC_10781 [Sphaeroforma arctica JP610]KNC76734.1 hypothetical protein SARC_10781 [Sphaeroforma arctica JP610]|eukprot:XP_014150636.1 hypothetical protein SARC_10781 [Sphaeroforma arctica JP610]